MSLDSVKLHLDEFHTLYVSLDAPLCKKRDLTESLLQQAEKKMRDLQADHKIHYYEVFPANLNRLWEYLRQASGEELRQTILAQGTPRIAGLTFQILENHQVRVSFQGSEIPKVCRQWLWLEYRWFMKDKRIDPGITEVQFHGAVFRLMDRREHYQQIIPRWDHDYAEDDWQLLASPDGQDIYLRLDNRRLDLENLKPLILKHLRERTLDATNSYCTFVEDGWKEMATALRIGEFAAGLTGQKTVLIGAIRPSSSLKQNVDLEKLPDEASNRTIDFRKESPARVVGSILDMAEYHARHGDTNSRVLSNVTFGFSVAHLSLIEEFLMRESSIFASSTAGKQPNYLLSMQVFPVFVQNRKPDIVRPATKLDTSWIKTTMREIAATGCLGNDLPELNKGLIFSVPMGDLAHARYALEKANMIKYDEAAKIFLPTAENLVTSDVVSGDSIERYYHSIFQLARLFSQTSTQRHLLWTAKRLYASPDSMQDYTTRVMELARRLLDLEAKSTTRDGVFQACIQFMPLPNDETRPSLSGGTPKK